MASLKLSLERTSAEREFYWSKLQDVELLCQRPIFSGNPMVGVIESILYAVDGKPDIEAEVRRVAQLHYAVAGAAGTPGGALGRTPA